MAHNEQADAAARFVDYNFVTMPKYWEPPELLDGYVKMPHEPTRSELQQIYRDAIDLLLSGVISLSFSDVDSGNVSAQGSFATWTIRHSQSEVSIWADRHMMFQANEEDCSDEVSAILKKYGHVEFCMGLATAYDKVLWTRYRTRDPWWESLQ